MKVLFSLFMPGKCWFRWYVKPWERGWDIGSGVGKSVRNNQRWIWQITKPHRQLSLDALHTEVRANHLCGDMTGDKGHLTAHLGGQDSAYSRNAAHKWCREPKGTCRSRLKNQLSGNATSSPFLLYFCFWQFILKDKKLKSPFVGVLKASPFHEELLAVMVCWGRGMTFFRVVTTDELFMLQ